MPLLRPVGNLKWRQSTSSDVVGYRVYWNTTVASPSDVVAKDVDYNSQFIDVTVPPEKGGPTIAGTTDLRQLPVWSVSLPVVGMGPSNFPTTLNAFKVGVAAFDKRGNLSDIVQIAVSAAPFKTITDFVPPEEPEDGEYYTYS